MLKSSQSLPTVLSPIVSTPLRSTAWTTLSISHFDADFGVYILQGTSALGSTVPLQPHPQESEKHVLSIRAPRGG